ncbi:MAG TPA: SDR family NAD(P)-dependent oxidoreductase [Burkholderiaceae bacterium]|nr:SDR family NAD(P)-dependent oxidoreductase [Burkholderiaceae bacterium]
MTTTKRHENRVVLVTGAAGGIGSAIAHRYAMEGARVGVVDRDPEHGRALAEELGEQGAHACFAQADVSSYDQCLRACETIQAELGAVDTLVNNAGISPKHEGRAHGVHEMDPAEWNHVVGVNLNSAFNMARVLTPGMRDRQFGRIVSMSSVAGKAYLDLVAAHYAATKAALIGFTRHLAGELGPYGITVNALAPGRIDTPLLRTVAPEANEAVVQVTPLRRLGTPEEVAQTCAWLTSPEAEFVTGQVVDVAGGWLMT